MSNVDKNIFFERDERGDFRTVDDIIKYNSNFNISGNAPEGTRRSFKIAKHCLIYSHYTYELIMPAAFYCAQGMDFAVSEFTGDNKSGLKERLKKLFKNGSLKPDRFTYVNKMIAIPGKWEYDEYEIKITKALVDFRNWMAHNAKFLAPMYNITFPSCYDIVNQLYPTCLTSR